MTFYVSLMLFVTVDTPDPYLTLRIKTAPEGRRRTKTKDNEVNPVWNEEFTFFLDGAVDNKLRMFTNPWQIVSIICSPLDVKNCRLFCLHRVFSLKGWGEGYLRRLHCKCDGKPSPHSLLSICVSTIHQVRGKRRKKLSFRKIGHVCVVYIGAWMIYCSMHCVCIMMQMLVVQ